jgi:carbamoyl-phosphate synthase large subunit
MEDVPILRGGRLLVADCDPLNSAGFFVNGTLVVPPAIHPHYVDRLLEVCRAHDVRVVVPHLDLDLDRLAPQQWQFTDAGIALVCPRADLVELCRDKVAFQHFARQEGLPQPGTFAPEDLKDDRFPLFAKRRGSTASTGSGVCRSPAEARAALERYPDLIFQELVEGPEVSVDAYVSVQGRCIVRVPRLRERVLAGEAVQSRTIRDAAAADLADRTISALARRGYRGPLNVQLFSTEPPLLIEVNARLGSASVLADQATDGRLFSAILREACGDVCGGDPDDYRDSVRLSRYWGEVFHDSDGPIQFSPPRGENV